MKKRTVASAQKSDYNSGYHTYDPNCSPSLKALSHEA